MAPPMKWEGKLIWDCDNETFICHCCTEGAGEAMPARQLPFDCEHQALFLPLPWWQSPPQALVHCPCRLLVIFTPSLGQESQVQGRRQGEGQEGREAGPEFLRANLSNIQQQKECVGALLPSLSKCPSHVQKTGSLQSAHLAQEIVTQMEFFYCNAASTLNTEKEPH